MPTENNYGGPEVSRDCHGDKVIARRKELVHRLARRIHATEILRWAASDDAAYPSPVEAIREAAFEIETLMRGLGKWSAVDPGLWDVVRAEADREVSPRPERRRNPWASRNDLWDPEDWDWS